MDKSWEAVPFCVGDKKGVIDLFKRNYPGEEMNSMKFLEWTCERNPAGGPIIWLAKNEGGRVVGFYEILPQRFKLNGKQVMGSVAMNTLVDKDYRNLGIFTCIANKSFNDCAKRGIYFSLGFPNPKAYLGLIKGVGFSDLAEIPLLVYPLNLKNLIKLKIGNKLLADILAPVLSVFFRASSENIIMQDNQNRFYEKWEDWEEKDIETVRDTEFLKWRLRWPTRNYQIFYEKKGDGVVAYLVGRVKEIDGIRNGFIVDFRIRPEEDQNRVGKKLIDKALAYFIEKEVDLVGCLAMSNTIEFRILRKNRFIVCPNFLKPQPVRAIVKWHPSKPEKTFFDKTNWFLSMIDYDVG